MSRLKETSSKGNKKAFGKNSYQKGMDKFSDDDIDAFQAQREKISLEDEKYYDQVDDNSSRYGEDLDEAVMDLPNEEEDDSWGRSKKVFYSADASVEDLADEVVEAKKLQKKQLGSLKTDHFGSNKKTFSSKGPMTLNFEDDEDEDEDEEEEKDIDLDEDEFIETDEDKYANTKDFADLNGDALAKLVPKQDKLDLLEKHAPETRRFLAEFRTKLAEIKDSIEPILLGLKKDTSKGLSFLETKYQLLVGYCANLAYYLLLKVRGKSIERHPVVERLVKYRLLLEKIKPMEVKLQYQVDKLLQASNSDNSSTNQKYGEEERALAFRPNMDMLLEASEGEGSDDDGNNSRNGMKSGVYKAPKVAPVHFNKTKVSKEDKLEEREKMLLSKSRLLADFKADMEDLPDEEFIDPVYGRSSNDRDNSAKNREKYEEETFTRFTLSKKEQRKMEKLQNKPIDELEDLNDFFRESSSANKATSDKQDMAKLLGIKNGREKRTKIMSGDDDAPKASRTQNTKTNKKREAETVDSDMSEIEDDMDEREDKFYRNAKNQAQQKKFKGDTRSNNNSVNYRPIRDMQGGDVHRPASYSMVKNRGLTPTRTKEQRNPRVKQRMKWERAQKRIGSYNKAAAMGNKKTGSYSGESSGIKTNLSRSVKF